MYCEACEVKISGNIAQKLLLCVQQESTFATSYQKVDDEVPCDR
jgi:hypothetical protein